MIDPRLVFAALCLYLCLLFSVALWVERRGAKAKGPARNAVVYSLSLAVYCTAWTYYGSVGKAATSGMLFLPVYLGPTLSIFLWWVMLRKMVRIKAAQRITSIADFISARYNKSQPLAALATIIAVIGILPYIALQLKAIVSTFLVITGPSGNHLSAAGSAPSWCEYGVGPITVVLMIAFTIMLGVRRLDPTERHEGMVMALAVECVVKLVAFLAAGVFVTYTLYDGFSDLLQRAASAEHRHLIDTWGMGTPPYFTWMSYLLLSMSAILFLPRQFHVAVVENSSERHILTAMWLFPVYMFLINIFVLPIALGGLIKGYPIQSADTFVLLLPLHYGKTWLSLLVFIGGVSAAAGMIMVSSITMATMITNHLLLPLIEWIRWLGFLKRHLLKCRWAAVAGYIMTGYWIEEQVLKPYMLANIGLISFTAVIQFAPVILGGIFWRRGNLSGAKWGLGGGFVVWCYTQLLPSFVKNGWLPAGLLHEGPLGIGLLKPEGLFGLTGVDPISHTLLWTMLVNVGLYVLGSLYFEQSPDEQSIAEQFVGAPAAAPQPLRSQHAEAFIDIDRKIHELEELLSQYFSRPKAAEFIVKCLQDTDMVGRKRISIIQLVEIHAQVEKCLAGSIGSAAAHKALSQGTLFSPRESKELAELYADILTDLKVTPVELKARIDYYQERESLLVQHADELREKVQELEKEISERTRAEKALLESERKFRGLVEAMNEGLEIENENGTILYVNDKLCSLWGCKRDEIIGCTVDQFIGRSRQTALEVDTARAATGLSAFETSWAAADGRQISAVVSSVPLYDQEERYKGRFSVITDISHIKALEREKTNLISMFAHDMRSSLTGIHGLALRLLMKSASLDDQKKEQYLRMINKEASKLESLVDDFLEFSRLETGRLKLNLRAASLETELMELFELYQPRASQKGLNLEIQIGEPLPIIEADVNRLRRVFTNLLDNALKFSKETGTITILVENAPHDLIIKVADQGIGIHPDEIAFIFDLFHRTAGGQKREGYGIGLATVKAIVEGHGGKVKVDSCLGEGSTFTVVLPKERKQSL